MAGYTQINDGAQGYQQQYATQQPMEYQQPPPNYGQNYGATGEQQAGNYYGAGAGTLAPTQHPDDNNGKTTFGEAFKIGKPKWNDLWAGILFIAVFCGFVVVSAISLQGYSAFKGFNGDGIYGNRNGFGLNTNTAVLFAFVLVVALVLSWAYITMARLFTKQFIWITGMLSSYNPSPWGSGRGIITEDITRDSTRYIRVSHSDLHALTQVLFWWHCLPPLFPIRGLLLLHLDPSHSLFCIDAADEH